MSYEIKVEDVEYTRHGGTPQLARLYRPQGTGPFPIMVELHGGAWCPPLELPIEPTMSGRLPSSAARDLSQRMP